MYLYIYIHPHTHTRTYVEHNRFRLSVFLRLPYVACGMCIVAVFLLLQIIVMIDFAYTWNESWTSEEVNRKGLVLVAAVILYAASIVLLAMGFKLFGAEGCKLSHFFLGFTIALTLILSALSVSPYVDKGGLLPAAGTLRVPIIDHSDL